MKPAGSHQVCVLTALIVGGLFTSAQAQAWRPVLEESWIVSAQGSDVSGTRVAAQDSALVIAARALAIAIDAGGPEDTAVGTILNRMGDYCYRKDAFSDAESLWVAAYGLTAAYDDGVLSEARGSLHRLGMLYERAEPAHAPPELIERVARFRDSTLAGYGGEGIGDLWYLAHLNECMRHLDVCAGLYGQLIARWEAHPGDSPQFVIRALVTLAEMQSKPTISSLGSADVHQDSSVILGERAVKIAETYFGPSDTLTAYAAIRLGDYYSRLGETERTAELWERASRINEATLPEEHIEVQGSIMRRAGLYRTTGRYAEALPLYLRAVRLRTLTQGPRHPETAGMYMNLGRTYHLIGDFAAADTCYRRALRIREAALEQVPWDIASSVRYLGVLAFDRGRFREAEEYFRRALTLREQSLGATHPLVASCLSDLAQLYHEWRRPEEALGLYERIHRILLDYHDPGHPDIADNLQDMALIHAERGNYLAADTLLRDALVILRRHESWEQAAIASALRAQGKLAVARGRIPEARNLYTEACATLQRMYSASDPRVIDARTELADVYIRNNETSTALEIFRAIDTQAHIDSTLTHPALAAALCDYARLQYAAGDLEGALASAARAYAIQHRTLADGATVMAEAQALRYGKGLQAARDEYLNLLFAARQHGRDVSSEIARIVFGSKNLVTDALLARYHAAHDATGEVQRVLADSLRFIKARLSYLYVNGADSARAQKWASEITDAAAVRDRLEHTLGGLSSLPSALRAMPAPRLADVASALPDSAGLVEYLRVGSEDAGLPWTEAHYIGVTLSSAGAVRCYDLGRADTIDSLVAELGDHMAAVAARHLPATAADLRTYDSLAQDLGRLIWSPVQADLADVDLVLIAADGSLNSVPFAALRAESGEFLIEEHKLHHVTTARDILSSPRRHRNGQGLLAIGDPDYEADARKRRASLNMIAQADGVTPGYESVAYLRSSCDDLYSATLPRLPGTRQEVQRAAEIWNQVTDESAFVLLDAQASEESFKAMAGGKRVIHIAAHGFYAAGNCRPTNTSQSTLMETIVGESPMLLSGLCLAGANDHQGAFDPTADDGYLTAEEVAMQELTGTQWVLLSACETANGIVVPGEGVQGLRRAFQFAGAETVIGTLWSIPDQSTKRLIGHLYASDAQNLPAALQQASRSQLQDMQRRGQPAHPYYWAPFIACGSWQGFRPR